MSWIRNAWNKFKAQPEIWFFYGFILTSPLSIRKVFFDYPLLGEFNEYSGGYLYLSDIFCGLTIGAWLISILYNNNLILSIKSFRDVLRGTSFYLLIAPLLLVIWSFTSISWANNGQIALYRSFKLFEFYLLYLFLSLHPKCSTWNILRNIFRIIIGIGLINAIIGILQVILQHSLGLFWLKESLISPALPGVAKIVLGGAKYIRAYGLFPHPNILGGFLLLSIISTFAYRKLFYPAKSVLPRLKCSTWNILRSNPGTFWSSLLGIQIVGEMLTFSKSAILGLILALAYVFFRRDTKMFHVEHFYFSRKKIVRKAFLLVMIAGLGIYLIRPDFGSFFVNSLVERLVYINISLNMISGNFLAGIGSGQFVLEMQKYSSSLLLDWQLQPVHNVFLLIWSELGLVGLGLFMVFLWKMFHPSTNVPPQYECSTPASTRGERSSTRAWNILRGRRGTNEYTMNLQSVFKALLIGFFVIALFDHYLWDIQQGQIMLWVMLGFLANTNIRNNLTK